MSSFDDIIKQKANSHQADTPDDVWDNIIKEKRKRRYGFFWWTFGFLLCGLLIIGYYNYKNEGTTTPPKVLAGKTDNIDGEKRNNKGNNEDLVKTERLTDDKTKDVDEGNKINNIDKHVQASIDQNKRSTNTNQAKIESNEATHSINRNEKVIAIHDKEATANGSAGKSRLVKKDKGKVLVKTDNAETGELAENTKEKNIAPALPGVKKGDEDLKDIATVDKKETVIARRKAAEETAVKKDIPPDSAQNKIVSTQPNNNKKENDAAKKQPAKHPWFIDVAITPVFPIQEYDQPVSFSRTLYFTDSKSEFSGKLVHSDLDPSIAFSLGVRTSINKKLSVGAGLRYLQFKEHIRIEGTQTNTTYKYRDMLIDNSIGAPQMVRDTIGITVEGDKSFTATNGYRFLSVPVSLQYNFLQKSRWSLGIATGLNINICSAYRNEINRDAKAPLVNTSQNNDKTTIGFALYAGLRAGWNLNKRIEIFGTPYFSYMPAQQQIKNSLVDKKIHEAGISVGISFRLN